MPDTLEPDPAATVLPSTRTRTAAGRTTMPAGHENGDPVITLTDGIAYGFPMFSRSMGSIQVAGSLK